MKVQYLQTCCLAIILCMIQTSFAESTIKTLLVVRPDGSWPPQEMVVDGELSGLHIELTQTVAARLNINITFKSLPWKRAIEMFKNGDADAITYMAKTSEREQFGYFLQDNVLSKASVGFFILKKYQHDIRFSGELNSLQDYLIGSVLGFSYDEEFDEMASLNKFNGAENEENLIKMLIAERVSIAIGHVDVIKFLVKHMNVADKIMFLSPYLTEGREHYLVFARAKGHGDLANQFANAMRAFKSTPEYTQLLKKYGIEE